MLLSRIPDDILYHILQYLPAETLESLVSGEGTSQGFNGILEEKVLKSVYETVKFEISGEETKRICAKISDEKINDVVRNVIVFPWLVQPRTKSARSLTENVWNRVNRILDPDYLKNQAEERLQNRLRKDVKQITTTVLGLKCLKAYRIDWDGRSSFHPELYKALLSPLLGKLADRLLKLSLNIPPEMLGSLTHLTLPKLQELDIQFCTGSLLTNEINRIFDAFLVFVNNLKDSLQHLSISSVACSEHLELSYFFKYLGTFPNLRAIAISIPFDGAHLPSTTTFCQFIRAHATSLERLTLSATRCAAAHEYDPKRSEWKNWIQNIGRALIQNPLPRLREVELALRPLKADPSLLYDFLRLHASSLASLTLTDRVLDVEEVEQVLEALMTGNLRRLQFRVRDPSPELFCLLASRVPRLSWLGMSFSEVLSYEQLKQWNDCREGCALGPLCEQRLSRKKQLRAWELRTLAFSSGTTNHRLFGDLESVFVESIPALDNIVEFSESK